MSPTSRRKPQKFFFKGISNTREKSRRVEIREIQQHLSI